MDYGIFEEPLQRTTDNRKVKEKLVFKAKTELLSPLTPSPRPQTPRQHSSSAAAPRRHTSKSTDLSLKVKQRRDIDHTKRRSQVFPVKVRLEKRRTYPIVSGGRISSSSITTSSMVNCTFSNLKITRFMQASILIYLTAGDQDDATQPQHESAD